jgi:acetyltransferase-like isoleucine patch superfamily enzyme
MMMHTSTELGGVTLQNGAISTDGITINDNNISTTRSNDNLNITANGTGYIALGEDFDAVSTSSRYNYGVTRTFTGNISGTTQMYPNSDGMLITLTGDLTGSGRIRSEKRQRVDLAGFDITGSGTEFLSAGLTGFTVNPFLENNSATPSTATELTGYNTQATIQAKSGDLSLTNMVANAAINYIFANTGLTGAVTNGYGYVSWGMKDDGGAGTKSLTNYYHYAVKANGNPITPSGSEYGFYVDDTAMANYIGGVTLQNGAISTDGITINDNEITTSRSNDNLNITANGTGRVMISANDSRGDNNILIASENPKNVMIYEDANAVFGQYNYANYIKGYYKIDSGQSNSTSSSDRYRNVLETELDLNGKSSTSTSTFLSRGPIGSNSLVRIRNTGGTDVTLGNANGGQNGLTVYANTTNNITVTEAAGHSSFVEGFTDTGLTAAFTEAHGYYSLGLQQGGSGTLQPPHSHTSTQFQVWAQ